MAMAQNITFIPEVKTVGTQKPAEKKQKVRVAAYCRVSTESEEQESSYETQVAHYTSYINGNPEWEMVEVYADNGLSGTRTAKREAFNRMIADCEAGHIDMIITKSISHFARNTVGCLKYTRKLKELNIAVFFEKENINTLDAKGEVLMTIMAALASRPVWGAWIEIALPPDPLPIPRVAPRMGWLFTGHCLPACPGISPAAAFSPRAGWRCTCRNRTG